MLLGNICITIKEKYQLLFNCITTYFPISDNKETKINNEIKYTNKKKEKKMNLSVRFSVLRFHQWGFILTEAITSISVYPYITYIVKTKNWTNIYTKYYLKYFYLGEVCHFFDALSFRRDTELKFLLAKNF